MQRPRPALQWRRTKSHGSQPSYSFPEALLFPNRFNEEAGMDYDMSPLTVVAVSRTPAYMHNVNAHSGRQPISSCRSTIPLTEVEQNRFRRRYCGSISKRLFPRGLSLRLFPRQSALRSETMRALVGWGQGDRIVQRTAQAQQSDSASLHPSLDAVPLVAWLAGQGDTPCMAYHARGQHHR